MKTEFAYHNEKFWQPSKCMIENGVTILALLQAGWTFDTLIDHGHLVELEDSIDNRIRFDWGVDLRMPKNMVYDKPRCNYPGCVECNGPPEYTDEQIATLNADRAAELAQQATGCSDTSRVLIELLARRDAHGKAKYGTSLDRTDLSLVDWLQHQTEELLDGAGYAQAAKREAEKLLALEAPLRKLIGHLQENPPRIHNPSLRALVDLLQ